ncbi:MAG: membrane dipeptidase [Marinilabiliaceae bacterium]|nr:membrane dipeptidase [Marinilabiliaceae bacterium]
MKKQFADIHCHPHMRSFNWFRDTNVEYKHINYNPWHIVVSNKKKADKGKRAASYSQSDLIKLVNGNVKLVFAAFYPMEQGWFINNDISFWKVLQILTHPGKNKDRFWAAFGALFRKNSNRVSLIQKLVEPLYMLIPPNRIRFFRKTSYSYFDELEKEKDFLLSKSGLETESLLYPKEFQKLVDKGVIDPLFYKSKGIYQIAKNGEDARNIIESGNVAFVMIMEGANMFNTADPIEVIVERINRVKTWHDAPVFFIALAHHFNNYLCGHAHSLPDEGAFFINQTEGMHLGITDKGWVVIRQLLSLNDHLNKQSSMGNRILIDVKHMNAPSRQQYYRMIIEPRVDNQMDVIPVIASHVCYSGISTLDELVRNMKSENNNSQKEVGGHAFNSWNINMSDEDLRIIYASGGIVGLNFDQRVLGVRGKAKNIDDHFEYLWINLISMVDVIRGSSISSLYGKSSDDVWNMFSIGSDFDGYIDPANGYSTSLDFEKFHSKLIEKLSNPENSMFLINELTPVNIADKVCFDNAYDFMIRNFKSFS